MQEPARNPKPTLNVSILSQDRSLLPLTFCRVCGRVLGAVVDEETEWFCLYKRTGDPFPLYRFAKIVQKPLESYAERRCRDYPWLPGDTHREVANDVLTKMVRHLATFECAHGVWPRLYTYTKTAVVDELKKPSNQLKFQQLQPKSSDDDQALDFIDSASSPPDQPLIEREEDECVRAAIEHLPEDLRIAYQMRIAGATLEVIAQRLRCAPSTAHGYIAEAVDMIRKMLQ